MQRVKFLMSHHCPSPQQKYCSWMGRQPAFSIKQCLCRLISKCSLGCFERNLDHRWWHCRIPILNINQTRMEREKHSKSRSLSLITIRGSGSVDFMLTWYCKCNEIVNNLQNNLLIRQENKTNSIIGCHGVKFFYPRK